MPPSIKVNDNATTRINALLLLDQVAISKSSNDTKAGKSLKSVHNTKDIERSTQTTHRDTNTHKKNKINEMIDTDTVSDEYIIGITFALEQLQLVEFYSYPGICN